MSIVVVVRKNGVACIASDTLTMFGDQLEAAKYHVEADKIYPLGKAFVGSVGDAAHDLVLQSLFAGMRQPPAFRDRLEIFEWLRKQHRRLKDHYYLQASSGEDQDPYEPSHLTLLIASPFGIFGVYVLREVYEYTRFAAIGSGERYALGAMYSVYDRLESAEEIARAGVEAAIEFNSECGAPIHVHTVNLRPKLAPAAARAGAARTSARRPRTKAAGAKAASGASAGGDRQAKRKPRGG